jgi:DNA invertase Pin-like site-specific DNA recombinase
MNNGKRAALCLRVSTDGQTTENQRLELERVAQLNGWKIVATYEDQAISGAKGRGQRPGLDNLLKDANRWKFDIVAAWSVDRMGRSLQDLLSSLAEIHAVGIDLYLHRQGVDTSRPAGKAMFQMCGVFAEFERSMIRERVNAGLSRARANGKKLGRPSVGADVEEKIRQAPRRCDKGIRKIARELGVRMSVVQRVQAGGQVRGESGVDHRLTKGVGGTGGRGKRLTWAVPKPVRMDSPTSHPCSG